MSYWTLLEENRLREMYAGRSNAELAQMFRRSKKAIRMKLGRMALGRIPVRSDGISTTFTLSPAMKARILADSAKQKITVGSVIREILAAHYKMEGERTIAVLGGKSRKPRHPIVNNQFKPGAPSMPFVPMGRD